jgi:hypothetical protein
MNLPATDCLDGPHSSLNKKKNKKMRNTQINVNLSEIETKKFMCDEWLGNRREAAALPSICHQSPHLSLLYTAALVTLVRPLIETPPFTLLPLLPFSFRFYALTVVVIGSRT